MSISRTMRNLPRRDYAALNDGRASTGSPQPVADLDSVDSAGLLDTIEVQPWCELSSSESPSQVPSSPPTSWPSTTEDDVALNVSGKRSSAFARGRREQSRTSWTSEHFWITPLDGKWAPHGRQARQDRLLMCKRCRWSSSDSARHGTTSNLITHLRIRHRVGPRATVPESSVTTGLDDFLVPAKEKLTGEQALVQWVVQTRQPFTAVECPSFQVLLSTAGVPLSFRSADTIRNRIQAEFQRCRHKLQQDLQRTCGTVAISLDAWTSDHQLAILAIVGYWITADYKRQEVLLDFTELCGAHSGENMAEAVYRTLQELQVTTKLLSVTGDNASNNGRLCETLHADLCTDLDDDEDDFDVESSTRFRGRASFVRCLAHVVNLICQELLLHLNTGTRKDAERTLDDQDLFRSGLSSSSFSHHGVVARIRLLVLWITRSPQRRQSWKRVSPAKQIDYDIDTRWNSTYRMVADVIRLRKEVTHFTRLQPEVRSLLPTEEEWLYLQQIEAVLKPFWEYTQIISRGTSSITDSLSIYWSLEDLLEELRATLEASTEVVLAMKTALERATEKLHKFIKLTDDNVLYYAAHVLDPRVKTSLITARMSPESAQATIDRVRRFFHRQYREEPKLPPAGADRPENVPNALWKTLMKAQQPMSLDISDIDRYLNSPVVSRTQPLVADGDTDWVLQWWKGHAAELPSIAQAARDILAIPLAGVSVERVFSGARDVLGLRRHSMKAETMRWLVLLKDHYDREAEHS